MTRKLKDRVEAETRIIVKTRTRTSTQKTIDLKMFKLLTNPTPLPKLFLS